ncbi:hypothetical protein MMC30_006206 [Trapelia coarctata]|nr:hypothetical protein [Trapelia coarctata]
MPFLQVPSFTQAVLCAGSICIAYYLYWETTIGAPRRRFIKEKGCQPIKHKIANNPIAAVLLVSKNIKCLKEHTILDRVRSFFVESGSNTLQFCVWPIQSIETAEPENIKTILSLDFKIWTFGKMRDEIKVIFGDGIFNRSGAAWQRSRDMLRPHFARSQIADLPMVEKHIPQLLDLIPRDGSTVDLQPLFFRLTMDTATEFLFGESANSLTPDAADISGSVEFQKAFDRLQDPTDRGVLQLFGLLPTKAQYKRDCKTIHEYVERYVERGLASSSKGDADSSRHVLLYDLISQTSDKVVIRSELTNILFAGRDTTASFLSNIWFELAKRPDNWAELRKEVNTLEGRHPTYEQLKNMKYLRAVLNESLRLYPVVPFNTRFPLKDTVLPVGGGEDGKAPLFVPKGQLVIWNMHVMHRRKDIFGEDAEEFRPERWLDRGDVKGLRLGWEYVPFHGGPRICLGQQFALVEASYVTVRLMQEFEALESRDPEPWREKLSFTATCNGCKVALTPRT